jgi:hypothetical protein
MWLLVIVLLSNVPGFDKMIKLETYATSEECQIERNRIGYEMAAAYPNDRDFVIACQLSTTEYNARLLRAAEGSKSPVLGAWQPVAYR